VDKEPCKFVFPKYLPTEPYCSIPFSLIAASSRTGLALVGHLVAPSEMASDRVVAKRRAQFVLNSQGRLQSCAEIKGRLHC
jgi:hypothetical protein